MLPDEPDDDEPDDDEPDDEPEDADEAPDVAGAGAGVLGLESDEPEDESDEPDDSDEDDVLGDDALPLPRESVR